VPQSRHSIGEAFASCDHGATLTNGDDGCLRLHLKVPVPQAFQSFGQHLRIPQPCHLAESEHCLGVTVDPHKVNAGLVLSGTKIQVSSAFQESCRLVCCQVKYLTGPKHSVTSLTNPTWIAWHRPTTFHPAPRLRTGTYNYRRRGPHSVSRSSSRIRVTEPPATRS
jgi:hypothetical protein